MSDEQTCCEHRCTTREEMRIRHGDPQQFWEALLEANTDGFVTMAEAEVGQKRYEAIYSSAPETTSVNELMTPRHGPASASLTTSINFWGENQIDPTISCTCGERCSGSTWEDAGASFDAHLYNANKSTITSERGYVEQWCPTCGTVCTSSTITKDRAADYDKRCPKCRTETMQMQRWVKEQDG